MRVIFRKKEHQIKVTLKRFEELIIKRATSESDNSK
jgi:hypothetical protein